MMLWKWLIDVFGLAIMTSLQLFRAPFAIEHFWRIRTGASRSYDARGTKSSSRTSVEASLETSRFILRGKVCRRVHPLHEAHALDNDMQNA